MQFKFKSDTERQAKTEIKRSAVAQQLLDSSPQEISQYIDANVADVSSVAEMNNRLDAIRKILKIILYILVFLGRKTLRS